jgi:prevent-host-death family protein
MSIVTVRELQQQTTKVMDRVKAGETLVISENGRPVAILVPNAPSKEMPQLTKPAPEADVQPCWR